MFYEVILDNSETPNKCTISPLSDRADFHLISVQANRILGPLRSHILLHHEGQCLTEIRTSLSPDVGIASVDCIWRRLDKLLARIARPLPQLARIPEGFVTAYPRRSENHSDPRGGLATIEAIFIARALLGQWDSTLLSRYFFGRKFIELNMRRFLDCGIAQAADSEHWPEPIMPVRSALQRRRDRGRLVFSSELSVIDRYANTPKSN